VRSASCASTAPSPPATTSATTSGAAPSTWPRSESGPATRPAMIYETRSSLRVVETWETGIADYATLLRDHLTLTCRSIERILLQAYVPMLQTTGQVCQFLHDQRGYPVPPAPGSRRRTPTCECCPSGLRLTQPPACSSPWPASPAARYARPCPTVHAPCGIGRRSFARNALSYAAPMNWFRSSATATRRADG
jgi:hypothetical protein